LFGEEVNNPCGKAQEVGNNLQQDQIETQYQDATLNRLEETVPNQRVWDDTYRLNEKPMEVHSNSNEQRLPVQMSNLPETVVKL